MNIITWLKVEHIICLSKEEVERITDRNLMWKIFSIKKKKKVKEAIGPTTSTIASIGLGCSCCKYTLKLTNQ